MDALSNSSSLVNEIGPWLIVQATLDPIVVVHDEIDLPFGDVRSRLGGGLAGHNGLKSLKRELGSANRRSAVRRMRSCVPSSGSARFARAAGNAARLATDPSIAEVPPFFNRRSPTI